MDFSGTRISLRRNPLSYGKVHQAVSIFIRGKSFFAPTIPEGSYLDIGCGPNIVAGFIHLDYNWSPGIDLCWDITTPLPIGDSLIGGIFSEHCVEHISLRDFASLAKEMLRILQPGRWVRIIVPDGGLYIERYTDNSEMPLAHEDKNGRIYTPMMSINRIMRGHGHQFIYDYETMEAILRQAGFSVVNKASFGQGTDPKLLIDTPSRAVESLYVEARK